MQRFLTILCFSATLGCSRPAAALALMEIRTAADDVLVAFFQSTNVSGPVWNTVFPTNEVDTSNLALWTLNGQPVRSIHQFVTEAEGVDCHIYLHVPKLANGTAYTLKTPYGSTNFVFEDRRVFCEAIKVNQSGYSALSRVRYANFAIWLGDGGAQPINGALPTYTVFRQTTGAPVAQGSLRSFGQDASSGDWGLSDRSVSGAGGRPVPGLCRGLRLLVSVWRGRGFLKPPGICRVPCPVLSALRLSDHPAVCLGGYPAATLPHRGVRQPVAGNRARPDQGNGTTTERSWGIPRRRGFGSQRLPLDGAARVDDDL